MACLRRDGGAKLRSAKALIAQETGEASRVTQICVVRGAFLRQCDHGPSEAAASMQEAIAVLR
jgi:hypothetical protein